MFHGRTVLQMKPRDDNVIERSLRLTPFIKHNPFQSCLVSGLIKDGKYSSDVLAPLFSLL